MLALVGFIGLCLLVGAVDGSIVLATSRGWYLSLTRPLGTPPNWVVGLIWACVYSMAGLAGWLVWRRGIAVRPLRLWGWQLAANALWVPAFFGLHSPPLAFAACLVLLGLVVLTIRAFAAVQPLAGWLMAPYLAWAVYAVYLTAGFWWLNPI